MKNQQAEIVAIGALGWMAAEPDRMDAFLSLTGLDMAALQARAGDGEVLAAIMDWMLEDDGRVLDYCAAAGVRPEDLLAARAALPGGDTPHWT